MPACPRDATALEIRAERGFGVGHCRACSGLWLPSRVVASAVGHILNPRRQIVASPLLLCPDDGQPLIVRRSHGVELDFCGNCGGVWLDHGEVERILAKDCWIGRGRRPTAARGFGTGCAGKH
jgi:Zn-finger nucleic acid-binding protein